ncbi:hypothetical protein V5799_002744 [Amblyomma americanum]|uniref:Secreted protein n=1 Tax=Amblyomma americanum TaxID=6943 RepID=A0AAQ4DAY3_AMBAM
MQPYISVISAALLLVVLTQQGSADDDDMYQKPISVPDLFDVNDTTKKTKPSKPEIWGRASTHFHTLVKRREDVKLTPMRRSDLVAMTKVKGLGQPCRSSSQCLPNLCCLQRQWRGPRICLPRAGRYQRCSEDQVKGGYYLGHCPCLMGQRKNEHF